MKKEKKYRKTELPITLILFPVLFFTAVSHCYNLLPGIILNTGNSQASAISSAIGSFSLIPLVQAVLLAYITKNVFLSIVMGEITTVAMLTALSGLSAPESMFTTVKLFFVTFTSQVFDPFNLSILCMILIVCGMVEVVDSNGGFLPLAQFITGKIKTAKDVNLITLLLGFLVSFDDYSCVLIVAPVMKPITDKMRVSREKLAFIVDATAAPCAALMFVSTWVSTELMAIEDGFALADIHGSSYLTFIHSILFSFYPILCLFFILITGITGKEFGPMLEAEKQARRKTLSQKENFSSRVPENAKHILLPLLPIFVFAICTISGFIVDGYFNMKANGLLSNIRSIRFEDINSVFGYAHTERVMLLSAIISSVAAVIMFTSNGRTPAKGLKIWCTGVKNTLTTGIFLMLTWTFAESIKQLGTCIFLVNLTSSSVPYWLAPLIIFLLCCVISFSIGSIGTLFIAMPIAIPIAQTFILSSAPTSDSYLTLVVACVFSGALFGDHCSPISDTTIMTSKACDCKNIDHVRTQLPYALTIASCASVSYILSGFGLPNILSLLIGGILIILVIRIMGKSPDTAT